LKPAEGLSTPPVFKMFSKILPPPNRMPADYLTLFSKGEYCCFNDLEEPACQVLPSLRELKLALTQVGCRHYCMTGSGSSFFCFDLPSSFSLPDVQCIPVNFVNRKENQWYSLI
jgi:4-diphosphocytidyl-2-C-methyl-D-erythritol kinase